MSYQRLCGEDFFEGMGAKHSLGLPFNSSYQSQRGMNCCTTCKQCSVFRKRLSLCLWHKFNSELYFYLRCDACNTLNAAWCGIILGNSFSQIFSNWHMCTISEFLRVTQYWQCNFIYSHTKWNRPNTGYLHSLGTLFQRSIYQSKYKILRINGVFLGQFD